MKKLCNGPALPVVLAPQGGSETEVEKLADDVIYIGVVELDSELNREVVLKKAGVVLDVDTEPTMQLAE